jgi:hypothetical protein
MEKREKKNKFLKLTTENYIKRGKPKLVNL